MIVLLKKLYVAERGSSLFLVGKGGSTVVKFTGTDNPMCKSIRKFRAQKDSCFRRQPNPYYEIVLEQGNVGLCFVLHHDGTWGKGLESWDQAINRLNSELPSEIRDDIKLSSEAAKFIITSEFPALAGRLDRLESAKLKRPQDRGSELIIPHSWSQRAKVPSPRTNGFSYHRV